MGPEMKNLHSIPDLYTIISLSSNKTSAGKRKWCKEGIVRGRGNNNVVELQVRRTFRLCRHCLGLLKQSSLICNLLWFLTTIIILGKQTIAIRIQDDERFDERNKHLQARKNSKSAKLHIYQTCTNTNLGHIRRSYRSPDVVESNCLFPAPWSLQINRALFNPFKTPCN